MVRNKAATREPLDLPLSPTSPGVGRCQCGVSSDDKLLGVTVKALVTVMW